MRSTEQLRQRPYFIRAADGKEVPADRVDLVAEGYQWVVLTAKAPLAPDSNYEVMTTTPARGPVSISRFATAKEVDREAPVFEHPPEASAIRQPKLATCVTGELFVAVTVGAPKAHDASGSLLYGIWPGDSRDADDRPPLTYAVPHLGRLLLGHPGICSGSTFKVPDPKRQKRLALVIRAVDLAGHRSRGQRVEVDLEHPARELR
jgi:hypothetical protein